LREGRGKKGKEGFGGKELRLAREEGARRIACDEKRRFSYFSSIAEEKSGFAGSLILL